MTDREMRGLKPARNRFPDRYLFRRASTQTFGHLCNCVGGLLSDSDRKSVAPTALLAGTPVRSLRETSAIAIRHAPLMEPRTKEAVRRAKEPRTE